jgi:hypothetical protein
MLREISRASSPFDSPPGEGGRNFSGRVQTLDATEDGVKRETTSWFAGSARKCTKPGHFGHNLKQLLTMQTLAIISILALIAIGGAAYTDQQLTSQQVTQKAN